MVRAASGGFRAFSIRIQCLLVAGLAMTGLGLRSASAQDPVVTFLPGDSRIQGDPTVPHISRWSMTRTAPGKDEQQLGVWLDRHQVLESDGRTLHRFQTDEVPLIGRPRREVVLWDQRTMETLSAELENYNARGGWARFDYDGKTATQEFRRAPDEELHHETKELDHRVFEVGHGLVFLNLLEPKPGVSVKLPYHSRATDEMKWMTFEAVRYEKLETSHYGMVNTLLVQTSSGASYWTVPEAPYVYRLHIPRGDGVVDRWELLEYIVID